MTTKFDLLLAKIRKSIDQIKDEKLKYELSMVVTEYHQEMSKTLREALKCQRQTK